MTAGERDSGLAALVEKIADSGRIGCDAYKEGCLRRRIAVRMRACGVHTYEQYARVLDEDAVEYERLLDALTINVTKFYRNRETWDVLAERVLPALWQTRHGRLRCWSAGCASGEEPYTLAMLLLELAGRGGDAHRSSLHIDATDFDRQSLARAAEGGYQVAALGDLPPKLVRRYFTGSDVLTVAPEVQQLVSFRRHDITRDPPPAPPYDLIICRNVLIYFDRATQERISAGFVDALEPGSYLVLGKVETLWGDARARLVLEDRRERIFRRP